MRQGSYIGTRLVASEFLDHLYRSPNPMSTNEAFETYTHQDLTGLNDLELRRELARLEHRLLFDRNPSAWLLERRIRLNEAIGHAR